VNPYARVTLRRRILSSCLFLVALTTATHIPVKITSGAYWRPLPDTIPYEASIPLTYKTPWNHLDIYPTVPEAGRPPASFCANNPSRPTCQMGELLSQLNQQFVEHMELLEPSLNPLSFAKINKSEAVEDYDYDYMEHPVNRTKRALDFIGAGLSWCCGVATQRKLDSLVTDEHSFRSQLDLLNKGLRRNLQVLADSSHSFQAFSNQVSQSFGSIEAKIKEIIRYNVEHDNIVYKNQADTSRDFQRTLFFIFENSRRTLHLLKFFRDSLIMQDCKQHRIPQVIIEPNTLAADVTRLEGTVQGSQRKLAIPLSELSRYYKLDLADCTLVGQELIIQVRIPIVQQEASWELFELMTTPFAWNNHTCTIMHDTMYLAVSSHHSGRSLRPISGSSLHTCKPFENKLCYIARFNSHGSYGPQCALKMYTGATVDELNSHCAFRCHESQAMIISEVQDDVYVITHPQPMMLIQCGKTTQDIITSAVGKPGALQVHLPCNCQLRLKEDVVIPTRYPCGGNTPPATGLMHVLPATWSNLKSLHLKPLLHDTHPTFDNFTECLDTNWTLRVPHVNLSTNILDDDIFRTVQTNLQSLWDSYTPYEAHSDASVLIWNIVLSLAVLYLYRQNRLLAAAISRFPPAEASALSSRDLTSCLVVAFTALFLGLLSMWLCWKLYGRKGKLFKRKTVTDTERGAELEDLQEVDEELKELNRLRLPVLHPGIAKPRLHREATPSVGSY
jgi:hypothetical protein